MSWISEIDPAKADEKLKAVYELVTGSRGKLSNIMRVQSLDPDSMRAHLDLYMQLMFSESGISREQRELIGTAVSAVNRCEYCINHHAAALDHYWRDRDKTDKFAEDVHSFELPTVDRAIVDYVTLLTGNPSGVSEEHVNKLKGAGFTDREILRINMIAAYFNFVNRLVLGLGVEYSPEDVSGYRY